MTTTRNTIPLEEENDVSEWITTYYHRVGGPLCWKKWKKTLSGSRELHDPQKIIQERSPKCTIPKNELHSSRSFRSRADSIRVRPLITVRKEFSCSTTCRIIVCVEAK